MGQIFSFLLIAFLLSNNLSVVNAIEFPSWFRIFFLQETTYPTTGTTYPTTGTTYPTTETYPTTYTAPSTPTGTYVDTTTGTTYPAPTGTTYPATTETIYPTMPSGTSYAPTTYNLPPGTPIIRESATTKALTLVVNAIINTIGMSPETAAAVSNLAFNMDNLISQPSNNLSLLNAISKLDKAFEGVLMYYLNNNDPEKNKEIIKIFAEWSWIIIQNPNESTINAYTKAAENLLPKKQEIVEPQLPIVDIPYISEPAKGLSEERIGGLKENEISAVVEEKRGRGRKVLERFFPTAGTVGSIGSDIIRTIKASSFYRESLAPLIEFFRGQNPSQKEKLLSEPVVSNNNRMYLAQSLNRDKQLSTKSYYQDQYWKKVNNVSDLVAKALPTTLTYTAAPGSFTSGGGGINYFNESSQIQPGLVSCLTQVLQGKIETGVLDDELEVYGYLLWFFDETVDAVSRIYKSDSSDNKKIEDMVVIVNGCKRLGKSSFSSVKDYKDKILEAMNKDILVSAPTKSTKATIDSVEITVYGEFSKVGYENKGKINNCNSFVNESGTGSIEWSSPEKAGVTDNVKANATTMPNKETKWLKATDCKFFIASNAKKVDGIKVKIKRGTEGGTEVIKDLSVKLVKNGSIVGTDNASTTAWTAADVTAVYGSETDTWGLNWEPKDINDSKFGVAIAIKNEGVAPVAVATVAVTTVAPTVTAPVQPTPKASAPVETPISKMVKYIMTIPLKSGSKGENVATLQTEVLAKVKMGPQAESLATSFKKGTVKPGTYGATTADAVFFMKNVLAAWANKNKKTDDTDFAQIIKEVKSNNKDFTYATWNAFLKYVKANGG